MRFATLIVIPSILGGDIHVSTKGPPMSDGSNGGSDTTQKRATYLSLMAVFGTVFAVTAEASKKRSGGRGIAPLDIGLVGLAAYRTGRLLAFDQVTEPLRAPFTETVDGNVQPKGEGAQSALGELFSCPTCIDTWVAAALVLGLRVAPIPTRTYMAVMSASGVAEILDYAVNAFDGSNKASQAAADLDQKVAGAVQAGAS